MCFLQMSDTTLPLVLLLEIYFTVFLYGLPVEGQYIIRNSILISAALVVSGSVRHQTTEEHFI